MAIDDIELLDLYLDESFRIYDQQIHIAVFSLTNEGPEILFSENTRWMRSVLNVDKLALTKFALLSMISITQGTNYIEGAYLLPFGIYSQYRVIVVSIVLNNVQDRPIHERYFQVGIILPKDIVKKLETVTNIEDQLIYKIKPFIRSMIDTEIVSFRDFEKLKNQVTVVLNNHINYNY